MSHQFCDGCDSFAVTADLLDKYSANAGSAAFDATGGRWSGGSIKIPNNTSAPAVQLKSRTGLLSTSTKIAGCFWYKNPTTPSADSNIIAFYNSSDALLAGLGVTTSGTLKFSAGGGFGGSAGSHNVCDGSWHWIEFLLEFAGGGSTQTTYVDTIADVAASVSLGSGTADYFQLCSVKVAAGSSDAHFDDLFLYDDSSGAPTTAAFPLGMKRIGIKRPSSDVSVQFSRSTGGSNFSCIDEVAGDAADYVSSSTSGQKDIYGYTPLGFAPASIVCCVVNNFIVNPGLDPISFKSLAKNGGTEVDGASTVTPTTAATMQTSFPTDPATSAAWADQTAVDAADFGILVV